MNAWGPSPTKAHHEAPLQLLQQLNNHTNEAVLMWRTGVLVSMQNVGESVPLWKCASKIGFAIYWLQHKVARQVSILWWEILWRHKAIKDPPKKNKKRFWKKCVGQGLFLERFTFWVTYPVFFLLGINVPVAWVGGSAVLAEVFLGLRRMCHNLVSLSASACTRS